MGQSNRPSQQAIQALLNIILPNATEFSIHDLAGSYSNFTHLVKVTFTGGESQSIVVRRYNQEYDQTEEKPKREFKALELLSQHGLPVPKPLFLDDSGNVLGSPGIVTAFVDGKAVEPPTHASEWGSRADKTSMMLAKIHALPYETIKYYLVDDNVEGAWFLKYDEIPAYMRDDPDGQMVWDLVSEYLPKLHHVDSVLSHTDFWSGNILWLDGEISAVVDWEEAAYGDPAYDVAYCRTEFFLEGLDEAAETFTQVYKQQTGHALENLALWELASSVRPMTDPTGWFTRPHMEERFRKFIENAKSELLA